MQPPSSVSGSKCNVLTDHIFCFSLIMTGVSLKNHGADAEAEAMFRMGEETMRLPLDEKMKYEQGDEGNNFG